MGNFPAQFGKKELSGDVAERIREGSVNNQLELLRADRKALQETLETLLAVASDANFEARRKLKALINFIHDVGVELTPEVVEIVAEFEESRIDGSVQAAEDERKRILEAWRQKIQPVNRGMTRP